MNEAVRGKVVRPNIECTNGYIHLIDTVMLDDAPPYKVIANGATRTVSESATEFIYILVLIMVSFNLFTWSKPSRFFQLHLALF